MRVASLSKGACSSAMRLGGVAGVESWGVSLDVGAAGLLHPVGSSMNARSPTASVPLRPNRIQFLEPVWLDMMSSLRRTPGIRGAPLAHAEGDMETAHGAAGSSVGT